MPSAAVVARRMAAKRRRWGRKGWLGIATEPLTVNFPTSQLTSRVWIALGADLTASHLTWNWLDITDRVRHDLGISVTAGRRDQSGRVNASRCQLKISNDDGYFSRRNPHSPYFGLLGGKVANTPIWIERDAGNGFHDAYRGYVNEWPTRWTDPSGNDSYVVIQCSGIMRRLELGEELGTSFDSVILADSPTLYWRIDDPAGSSTIASSLPGGGRPMMPSGITFGGIDSPPGGDGQTSAADFSNLGYAFVTDLTLTPPFAVEWSVKRPTDGSADSGGAFQMIFYVDGVQRALNAGVIEDLNVSARDWYHYTIQATQSGSNWQIDWWKNGIAQGIADFGSGTFESATFIALGPNPSTNGFSIAYLSAYDHLDADPEAHSDALQAHDGEQAHIRAARICAQAGIPFYTDASASAQMGPEEPGKPLDVLRECESVDGGVLYERDYGFHFKALSEFYNQPAAFAVDFDLFQIYNVPEHADDDSRFRNYWTLRSSSTGASRTYQDPDYSVQDGLHPDAASVNAFDDDQLLFGASWRVRRDSVDEDRWTSLPINLAGTPELIPTWSALKLGQRLTAANPPAQVAPDTIDAVFEGYSERWDTVSWVARPNTSPASPFQVGIAGDTTTAGSWAQTADAVIGEDLDTTETAIDVTSTDDWANASPGGEQLVVGGEVVALTAVSGSAPNWTFTVTRSVNGVVKSHTAGASIRVRRPLVAVY